MRLSWFVAPLQHMEPLSRLGGRSIYSAASKRYQSWSLLMTKKGMLYTPMMYSGGMSPEMREARKSRSLLKTEGNAWDCAAAVRFLASDEARWITGAMLTVDAGATAAVSVANSGMN